MLRLEGYVEIQVLRRQGLSIRAISAEAQQKAAAQRKEAQARRAELDAERRRATWRPEGAK